MGQGANRTFNAITVILVNSKRDVREPNAFSNTFVSLMYDIRKGDLVAHAKICIALRHMRNITSKITPSTNSVCKV
jgi:hypothetical protein